MKKIILLTFLCLASVVNILAQAEDITKDEYYRQLKTAEAKGEEVSRRIIAQVENFRKEKLHSSEEFIYKYLIPDRSHYLHISKSAEVTKRSEVIQIGETYYCRTDNRKWKKSKFWCGEIVLDSVQRRINTKYTLENTTLDNQNLKLYSEYLFSEVNREAVGKRQHCFWLNEAGLLVRQEFVKGLLDSAGISSKRTEIYEYNPQDLKIEAPIK